MTENDPGFESVMWKRRVLALLVLGCGTLVWYYCGTLQRNIISLVSDVLLSFICSLALMGVVCRHLRLSIPVDPLEWQVSSEAAHDVAACLANTIGAAEGVLRVAASGSDSKLFFKVVLVLCVISAIGRAASGATLAYIVLWLMFIFPLGVSKLAPEVACNTPTFLQKKFSIAGSSTPGNSPRSYCSSQRMTLQHA